MTNGSQEYKQHQWIITMTLDKSKPQISAWWGFLIILQLAFLPFST